MSYLFHLSTLIRIHAHYYSYDSISVIIHSLLHVHCRSLINKKTSFSTFSSSSSQRWTLKPSQKNLSFFWDFYFCRACFNCFEKWEIKCLHVGVSKKIKILKFFVIKITFIITNIIDLDNIKCMDLLTNFLLDMDNFLNNPPQ